jgi:hypothetical protein
MVEEDAELTSFEPTLVVPRDGYKSCAPTRLYDDGEMLDLLCFVHGVVVDLLRARAACWRRTRCFGNS